MSLVNAYATLAEFTAQVEIASDKPVDDVYIEDLLNRSSREFDGDTGHWFYAYTQTRTFDTPEGRELRLDRPLLSVTSITNGDGTLLDESDYLLRPANGPHHTSIKLKATSSAVWLTDTNGEREGVISVTGTWGYVNRSATDPESAAPIYNSKTAVLALALAVYRKRYGLGTDGAATVTGAGVVITPRDKSREYWAVVSLYRRLT